jgi:hypothetical protein
MDAQDYVITDTDAITHDMRVRAKRGLTWALGASVALHFALLWVQFGGNTFGFRAPTADDASVILKARLSANKIPETANTDRTPTREPQRDVAPARTTTTPAPTPSSTTIQLTAPTDRASDVDPLPPPVVPVAPRIEVAPVPPPVTPKEPEPAPPTRVEKQAPIAVPQPVLPVPPPVVATPQEPTPAPEPAPAKDQVAEPLPTPAPVEPVKPAPEKAAAAPEPTKTAPVVEAVKSAPIPPVAAPAPAAPAPAPATATPTPATATPTPTPPAASPTPTPAVPAPSVAATPTLTQSAPAPSAAPAAASPSAAPAAGSSAPAAGAPSSGRPSAVVILPGPSGARANEGAAGGSPAAPGGSADGKAGESLRPGFIDGFDPAAARRNAARDAAKALNAQRPNVPPSVAPSLTERERMAKNVENAVLPDCSETAKGLGLLNAPVIIAGVLVDKGCRLR